eukprot:CAMPEP_0185728254 /NCGR_PEP_ID=MMETSP1171-20130828/3664_1 /TAXON_ID=374046 /ORGANISM="Helicotheca tamensis, Strain CCMP826" /LENGTH=762 /DNA_ID=CAMNT_0028396937 /DNA_START=285 /DNA_END=2573 /DNA_ORIENTATION=+
MGDKYKVDWKTVLGEGAYGSVYPARRATTGEKVALKKISKRFTSSSSFKTETDALLRIYDNGGHPNISGLRDMYEDYNHFYLIMDLVSGGEMFEHLINYGAYSEADASRLMQEVASALAFLHGVGVVHADLKPENLLLCSKKRHDGTIKIIDFGCSVVSHDNYHDGDDDDVEYENEEMRRKKTEGTGNDSDPLSIGTTAYWPKERFNAKSAPNGASDMWAVGVILYIMLVGVHPFDVAGMSTDEEIEERIMADPTPPLGPEYTGHLTPSAVDLIQKLMTQDPDKRMTADEMLRHPWVRGETATTTKMADSDKKLSRFKDLRHKLEAGIFHVLVNHGNREHNISEARIAAEDEDRRSDGGGVFGSKSGDPRTSPTNIMKRAFEVFDSEGKGFATADDLGRVIGQALGSTLSSKDLDDMLTAVYHHGDNEQTASTTAGGAGSLGLSLVDFNKLFANLRHQHFPRGHIIFNAGDKGDSMYFINSGKVEVQTRKGQLVSILRHGDFFGEGSLLEERNVRFTTAKCATPVDVIKINKEEFDRYLASSKEAKKTLSVKWKARTLAQAKNLLRLQTNVKALTLKKGEVVYKEGDEGKSMFFVDEVDGGTLEVQHDGHTVHEYTNGDSFGESSLLFERPRSSTVICVSENCRLQEMLRSDFLELVESSPDSAAALKDMCRKRLFKKAVKAFSRAKNRGLENDDLIQAFYDADTSRTGHLSLDEVRELMHRMDPDFPEHEVAALLSFIDFDGDGQCSLEEFKRLFRSFEQI